jgi:hypothetical protein
MKILILTLLLITCVFSQYDLYIDEYQIIINRVNDGYQVDPDGIYNERDTINIEFEIGHGVPSYESPYTSFEWNRHIIPNDPLMWDDTVASARWEINYPIGTYELIMVAVHLDLEYDTLMTAIGNNAIFIYVDTSDVSLSIDLNFFEAVLIDGKVSLSWATESEIDNCGFNIYRKEHKGLYKKMTDHLIPGEGNTLSRTTYGLVDASIHPGSTYEYTLESLSCSGIHNIEGKVVIYVPMIYGIFLAQNFPNPFNDLTSIEYAIDEKSEVSLHLYDISGRTAQVFKKVCATGTYIQTINADNMASGTYIYFLRVHNIRTMAIRILSKKMTVLK